MGYINIKKNLQLLIEDTDLSEEYKVFGEDVSGTEYPVWIRAVYQNKYLSSDLVVMSKIDLYDVNVINAKQKSKDFVSHPLLITEND